jgi:hypothetical protein
MPIIDWRLPKLPSVQEVVQQASRVAQPVVEKLAAPYQPFAQDLYENATRRLATPTEAQSAALRETNTRALPGAVSRLGLPATLTQGAQVEPSELTIAGRKTAGHTLSTGDGLRFFVPTDPSTAPVGLTPRARVALETRDQQQQVQRDANDPLKNAAANLTDSAYYGWAAGRIGTGVIDSGKAAVQGTLDTLNPFRKVEPLDFSGWRNGVDILRADPAGSLQSFFRDPANAAGILTDTALIAGTSRVSKPGTTSPKDVPASRQTIDVKATTVVDPLPPARTTPRTTTTLAALPPATTGVALPPATTGAALPPATTGAITTSPRSTPTRLTNQADFLRTRLTQQLDGARSLRPQVPQDFVDAASAIVRNAHESWDVGGQPLQMMFGFGKKHIEALNEDAQTFREQWEEGRIEPLNPEDGDGNLDVMSDGDRHDAAHLHAEADISRNGEARTGGFEDGYNRDSSKRRFYPEDVRDDYDQGYKKGAQYRERGWKLW